VFSGTDTACYSCHQSDYAGAPDHSAINLSLFCEDCHNTTDFVIVDYGFHDPFRINGGPHDEPCADCHIAGTTNDFSCYGHCHKHTEAKMDDKHSGVNGYAYHFPTCLNCHPDGRN
jgi:hypothetical protein